MNKKICPTCGAENGSGEMMCLRCMADISAVIPAEEGEKENYERKKVVLSCGEETIAISNGDIIGREYLWKDFLAYYKTVSRNHFSVIEREGKLYIKDSNSTNGTYINGIDIRGRGEVELKAGDKLSLSRGCIVEVKEG